MNEANIQGLDTLETWRKAIDFAVMVSQDVIPLLPSTEKWNLQDQLRRAGSTVPANIVEGHGRYYFLDNVRFCYVARGWLTEVQSHISVAHDLGYLPSSKDDRLTESAELLGRQLNAYIAYRRRTRPGAELQPSRHSIRDEPEACLAEDDMPAN